MKKSILLLAVIFLASYSFAQSDKYVAAMKTNINQIDSIMAKQNGAAIANNFLRIGEAEKTQWLPYYYAAYVIVSQGLRDQDVNKKDGMAQNAKDALKKAEDILGKENSEIATIKSMIATLEMTVDPQSRYMTYGPIIEENIKKAESLDPTNPRPILVQAQNLFYTPEAFGGGKDAAKKLFDDAKLKFDSFKPESELSPMWGKGNLDYFLAQYK